MYDIMAISFAGLVESRDGITGGHLKNTAIYYKCFIDYLVTLPVYSDVLTPVVVKRHAVRHLSMMWVKLPLRMLF